MTQIVEILTNAINDLTTGEVLMPDQQQPIADALADALFNLQHPKRSDT